MSCKSLLYAITPTNVTVISGATVPLSQIARRISPRLDIGSDSVMAYLPGYYKVHGTLTCTAEAAGNVTIQVHKNGVAVPGAVSSATITTPTTQVVTLPFDAVIRVLPEETAIITLVNEGVDITVSNLALTVESV